MNKNVLIIGSQGYLGSRLVEYLFERGYHCGTIDTGFFKDGILYNSKYLNAIYKDAREITYKDLESYKAVILLAGISNDPFGNMNPETIYNPSRDYAFKIAKMCKKSGVKFIFPSSCSVYGAAGIGYLDENGETNPQTYYSKNKLEIEQKLNEIADETFQPIALRFATVYGMSPRIRFDVFINMLCGLALTSKKIKLNSDGQAWRPNLHIDDACESIYRCLNWNAKSSGLITFNVGQNEDNYKIIDIANLIRKNVKSSSVEFLNGNDENNKNDLIKDKKIQDGVDTRTYKVSFNKILKDLPEFKCKWNVENGICDLIKSLSDLKLNEKVFNKRHFYRLQQIEYLHTNNLLDDNLRWLNIN